jgi:hypothetical protein
MAVTTARAARAYTFGVEVAVLERNGARVMNAANNAKRDNRTDGLTEAELSKVAGGLTPSIPIPPPRPGFLAR